MKIRVDEDLCQGHNMCQSYVADLLSVDEFGFTHASYDGHLDADQLARAQLAESNCPEQAIILFGDQTNND